jgi:hypothetical protein
MEDEVKTRVNPKTGKTEAYVPTLGKWYDPETQEVVYDNTPGSLTVGMPFIRKKNDTSVGSNPTSNIDTAIKAKDVGDEQIEAEKKAYGSSTAEVAQNIEKSREANKNVSDVGNLTWEDVKTINGNDPEMIALWLNSHKDYTVGDLTKKGMESLGYVLDKSGKWVSKDKSTANKEQEKKEETIFDMMDELDTRKSSEENKATSSALEDTTAEDEALDKKSESLNKIMDRAKLNREELDEEWDKLIADSEEELKKHEDASNLSEFLPRFAIQHYLDGNFGKRGSAKAIGTLGYFILDKIGASLVNASQVARGMTPTQKTALEEYNSKQMENAIARDDKNRAKINEEKINNIIKNSDALRQAGIDTNITLGNDMASKYLSQYADQIDEQVYLKLKKQSADWYDKLTDAEKMSVDRLFLAISTNPSERQNSIFTYQLKEYEANAQEDTARAEKAKYEQEEAKEKAKAVGKLTDLQIKKAETEIENMKRSGLLTDAQVADAWKQVSLHAKDLEWYDTTAWQKQITGYIDAGSRVVDSVTPF